MYAYDRRQASTVKEPLYGHTSMETAYLVNDYPYGRTLRCRIRYWLESDGKRGFRFVSQTEDPRNGRWNNPKKSTYAILGANMYLDEKTYVQWAQLSEYSKTSEVLDFVKNFPHTDMSRLKVFVPAKMRFLEDMISGKRVWHVNNVPKPPTEYELGEYRRELEEWNEVSKHLH